MIQLLGELYVSWTDLLSNKSGSHVYFAFPIDQSNLSGGWVSKIISGNNSELITGAVPAVGPNGAVYVAYDSNATGGTSYIDVAMSTDGGNNFSDESVRTFTGYYQQLIGKLRVSSFPTIAVDPQNSEVYVAWTEEDNGTMDIYFTHTTGAREITSWSTPQVATQTTTGNQFFPWLSINSTGHISLLYYQENANDEVDVYSAQSYDGQSFVGQDGTGEDVKLTSVSSNPTVGSLTSDYIGVTSSGSGEAHALWTDFRSGSNEDIYCASYNQQPTVTLTGPTYIDAGGSGAYYLINGSQSNSIPVDLGTSITLQSVPQNSGWAFAGWNFGSDSNPVTYYPTDNVSLSANLKELQHSMDASAYSDNGQRKMIQTPSGYLFEAYTDDGHVWVEYSSNQGSSWTLANNGEPLDYNPVNGTDHGSKCPSLDYDPSSSDVIVVFQEPYGSTYQIDYAVFVPSGSTYIQDADGPIYTEGSDSYSVNANPDFAMYNGFWLIAFEKKSTSGSQTAGINYLFGTFNGLLQSNGAAYSMWDTDASSTKPSIYGAKTQSGEYADVAWQEGSGSSSTIRFAELALNTPTMDTLGQSTPITISNSAWPANYQPSLVQEPNSTAWVCWIANNFGRPPLNITLFSTAPGASNYNTIDYNESSVSVNLPNGGSTPYIAFSQASASNSWTAYACNYNASSMITLSTTGRDMQLSNGASTSSMYASAFNPSSSPYPLETSGSISGAGNSPAGNANTVASVPVKMTYGRGGTISYDSLNFYYSFRNLSVDGQSIGFAPCSDSTDYDSLSNLNKSLVTEPFQVNTNSRIIFSEYSGFADSTAAISVLGDTGYINYNVEVIDNSTGKLVGTIKNIRIKASNAGGYKPTSYLLSTDGIANRTVKVKIDVSSNLTDPKFALINSYSQVDSSASDNLQSLSLEPITVIKDFVLSQNYPNPFNPTTVIDYTIPKESHVTLKIYDVLGQEVRTLVDQDQQVGRYSVNFNGSSLASGVYFYRLFAGNHVITKKMLLLK